MLSYKLLFFLPLISTIFTYPFGVLLGEKTAQYFSSTLISIAAILSWFLFISFSNSSSSEKTKATKNIQKIDSILIELKNWEKEVIFPLASQRLEIDLDDGVKINYPILYCNFTNDRII